MIDCIHTDIDAIVGPAINAHHGGIYQIQLIGTNRCYVGRSIGVGGRLYNHVKALLQGKHFNAKLQNAWNKYGPDQFAFCVLQEVEGPAMVEAEQFWINHHQAASIGFNIVALVDPYNVMDRTDPNVIQYWFARDRALGLASSVAENSKLRGKDRATVQDCLQWNAYAINQLGMVPQEMIKKAVMTWLTTVLVHANGLIRKSKDATLLRYINEPNTYPHDAWVSEQALDKHVERFGTPLMKAWRDAEMKWTMDRVTPIVGETLARSKRRKAYCERGLLDDSFINWVRSVGVPQPTAAELREAGLITWELK